MKRFVNTDLLLILVGMACFTVIYAGSGILNTQKGNRVKHRMPPGQRYLCEPDQDALMMNPHAIQDLTDTFNRAVYLSKNRSGRQETTQFLVADHGLKYPLHISVETNAEIGDKESSISCLLKSIHYYKKD